MTINNNSVEQINVALLDMDKKLKSAASKSASASDFKNLEASVDNIKRTLNETKTGLEPGKTYNINISGNAATADKAKEAEKAGKLVNALTVNGETYDGSEAVDAGVQKIENGGTGATTAKDAFMSLANGLSEDNRPLDTEYVIYKNTGGTHWGLYTLSTFWNYIKDKISSVLGLTAANYGGTANKATNDGNGNNIVNTYALKSNLQYTKSINIMKVDGSSDTSYYLIAKTPSSNEPGNIDSIFVNGSDYMNRMFEGSIRTRTGNYVFNYGKNNLPIEIYEQTDGTINVYWLVSDAYNRVALNITATEIITTYGGNLSPVTPTGSKMTLTEYDYKSYRVLPVARGGTGVTTQSDINKAFVSNLESGESDVTDGTEFVSSYASDNGFAETAEGALNKPYKRQFIKVWNYIKGKISSVLGLTKDNYGGKAAKSGFLDEYPGAGGTRLTSGNIKPKDASEYGGMRKDVVTSSMTDSGRPGQDGHVLTMFWDSDGRWDAQLFLNCEEPPTLKARVKNNTADYGPWVDIITSNNIGSQTVARAGNAGTADSLFYRHGNEINFQGGAPGSCYFNWRNADTEGPSPVDTMQYIFCNYSSDTSKSVLKAGSFDGNTAKVSSKMRIPIGAPSSLEDGCLWIER